ncbi:AMP-forming adenylation domain superfamily protein, putative D-alanine:D-alanyl carrier protein ligase [Campylobacter pinnipediorum subsp. caledonicus]|nr:AMP-forming adenylation domain superfamily protein, putative D-alanine:D-alanyl carrier protein ligase [Campylobacter pinnipediorum subsp. caledonicus]
MLKEVNIYNFLENSLPNFKDKILFFDKDKYITYAEFDLLTSKIASKILSFSLKKMPILILLPKGIDCIGSMFATARSGNFYCVLDIKNPEDRIKKIVKTLKPKLLITSKKFDFNFLDIETIYCEDFDSFLINDKMLKIAENEVIDTDLLYVLFTSGTTGEPKGVCIPHKNAIEYIDWVCSTFEFNEKDVISNSANLYADKSIFDIFSGIKVGATIHLLDSFMSIFPDTLLSYWKQHGITTINLVPSVFSIISNSGALYKYDLPDLKKIFSGGEIIQTKQFNAWINKFPNAKFVNLYGPTEITSNCAYFVINRKFNDDDIIPIGKARRNFDILLLNADGKIINNRDIGKKGEICVRGSSISYGYYANQCETNKRFIQNPYNKLYEEKIYKTGDIGFYNKNMELVCIGRLDNQIKIAGYRIELEEIENTCLSIEGVDFAACIFKEKLICFYISSINEMKIKQLLSNKLINYMMPDKFIKLKTMPLNANGKIDRKGLVKIYESFKKDF